MDNDKVRRIFNKYYIKMTPGIYFSGPLRIFFPRDCCQVRPLSASALDKQRPFIDQEEFDLDWFEANCFTLSPIHGILLRVRTSWFNRAERLCLPRI